MTSAATELFKAIFAVAIFACVCGLVRLALLEQLEARLKLVVGSFLTLMLMPTGYLYLRLAFPQAAASLLPFQSMSIWAYGPLLLAVLHIVSNRRMRSWRIAAYALPLTFAVALRLVFHAGGWPLPGWWELLALAQASAFAAAAMAWTVRGRAQLRILVSGFAGSSFGGLLYLSVGLLALLLMDFFVHWRLYFGPPLTLVAFYLSVTPGALYALGISMALIWRAAPDAETSEGTAVPAPVLEAPAPEVSITPTPAPAPPAVAAEARNLELSAAAAHELALHLDVLMREQRLYTRNDLTLGDLAAALRVSTHLASELLNAHLHTNFYEFLNRHRAEDAAQLLRAGKGKFSIADIAYQAGFNNPNTFYREFKRAHGVTPAQFRRSAAAAPPEAEPPDLPERH
jgi:AraC-like DNA-binding protein